MSGQGRLASLVIFLAVFLAVFGQTGWAEEVLNDRELTDLLYALNREEADGSGFLVLPEDYKEPFTGTDGVYSLLLVGVDADRAGVTGRSDTMVLAVLSTRTGSVSLVSFLRDLYVEIPGRGHNRLNAAYVYGGPELLIKTLQRNFDVQADGYLAVDFSLMANLVDAIGGIPMTVLENEVSPLNGILGYYNYQNGIPEDQGKLERGGTVTLSGPQAMAYARIRKIDDDFSRVQRQQRTLEAIFRKMLALSPEELLNVAAEFASRVKTDLTLADVLELSGGALRMSRYDVRTLTVPVKGSWRGATKNKASILLASFQKNIKAIEGFLEPVFNPAR